MDVERYLPKGARGKPSSRSGRCVVCGVKFSRKKLIQRDPNEDGKGVLVCLKDSPHVSDEDAQLHTQPTHKWPRRRLLGLDADSQTFEDHTVSARGPRPRQSDRRD